MGKNTAKIQGCIKHQFEEDKMGEQLSIPYSGSPFKLDVNVRSYAPVRARLVRESLCDSQTSIHYNTSCVLP